VADLSDADWILGATSGGRVLDVSALAPGTVVIDDSFPRSFDDAAARARMERQADVMLMGGGMLDAGPLLRSSPFPGADALRQRFGARWLPGCHAEVLLLAAHPDLGPTVGAVTPERAQVIWDAVEALGWDAPPLHLGAWELPGEVVRGVASAAAARMG
jgi:predicted amino acid dehydrogenase